MSLPVRLQKAYRLLLLVLLNAFSCESFASWLVDRSSSCYVFLRDDTEVIMNNKIKMVNDSSHPNGVYIVVSDANTMEPVDFTLKDDGTKVVSIHQSSTGDKTTLRYHLSLVSHPDLKDLQYVMDAIVLPELDEEHSEKDDGQKIDVRFTTSTRGCEDKRAHGRKNDNGLEIVIEVPSSTFETPGDDNIVGVDIVAGWACDHEAVTLTHAIQFIPTSYMLNHEGGIKNEQGADDEKEQETDDANLPDAPGSVYVEPDEIVRRDVENIDNTNLRRGRRYEREHPIEDEMEEESATTDGLLKEFKNEHDKETYGQGAFSIISYMVGLLVFCVFSVGTVTVLISRSKQETKEL